jgi:hypothetical protein
VNLRKPAFDLSDVVRHSCSIVSALAARSPGCSGAPSGQAPMPHSGAPKARGLTATAPRFALSLFVFLFAPSAEPRCRRRRPEGAVLNGMDDTR